MVEQQSGLHILDVETKNHMKQKNSVVISVQFLTWEFFEFTIPFINILSLSHYIPIFLL